MIYRNDPKFTDRQAGANSVDPDQTAPLGAVWSGSTLFAILSTSFGHITLCGSNFRMIKTIFGVSEFLGFLRYLSC